ncbi:MAG: ABC transporter ATP-binding protein [Gammaproteobacteria bacterium]|nr:ABC transporter ATP-binding protein [Gammaproteobacteria bacterium]MYF38555.1 ABC transporter ATP-binding protein [Gammaproteobacteria bacterium]
MTIDILRLSNVSRVYGKDATQVRALTDVSLSIAEGEFVSIVGPSGCGKSTILNMMGALDQPTQGEVHFDGDSLSEMSRGELTDLRLQKFGFVFQAFNLLPVLTAAENVQFILQLLGFARRERQSRTEAVLDALGLADVADRPATELSGGQQQRVAIARALVGEPALLFADEPSANLDSTSTRELCELLRQINSDRGITVITATHDPLVMSYTSRSIHLEDGRVVEDKSNL